MNPDVYHAHLDVCSQCRNHPFNLCREGVQKLHEAVGSAPLPETEKPHQEEGWALLLGSVAAVATRKR